MKWRIDYSKDAGEFIDEHKLAEKVRESLKNLILKINGQPIKMDLKKLKGKWKGFLRIRKGKVRIVFKIYKKEKRIFVKKVDFRGHVY